MSEHELRRDDPLRLEEWRVILRLAEARAAVREREREELQLEAQYRYEQARGNA